MLKQINKFFKKYHGMANAVDYLTNHMNYHLIHTYKLNCNSNKFVMLGREQLAFLVTTIVKGLSDRQINQVISLALKNVSTNLSANFMVTRHAIYVALV